MQLDTTARLLDSTARQPDTTGFSDRLQTGFAEILYKMILPLLGAVIMIFAGYLLAKILAGGVERGLRRIHLTRMLQRAGVIQAVERSGTHVNPPRVIANLTFWLVMFAVILLAAHALGLYDLADEVRTLVSYIPSVIAAVVILLVGSVLGGFVEGLITASSGAIHGGRSLARLGRGGVILLSIFMALQHLGIATDIVTTAFAILFGAIALAMALAFGLGNRDLAGEVTRDWYVRFRKERQEMRAREQLEESQLESEDRSEPGSGEATSNPNGPAFHPPGSGPA